MGIGLSSRELNHRIKSISASRFTPQEIAALRNGGNEVSDYRMIQVYLIQLTQNMFICACVRRKQQKFGPLNGMRKRIAYPILAM
jgi:hypothetical protein